MPPTISASDLIFSSQATDFARTLSSLKRSTLSITNRLRSIIEDADFAKKVSSVYNLPLVANERCGSWYIPPQSKVESCYFKSTDGHTGQWSFSLRRLNVQVFDVIAANGGCIVVDSTRRGKAMPDALMKTVPIWCAVFNRLIFPDDAKAGMLYTPPKCVSGSEHAQIEQKLDGFVKELRGLALDLAELREKVKKPLRPLWITRESELPLSRPEFRDFHPLVLCTASRRVIGGEISEGGYIQGAGDDAEGWSNGLTPALFWAHKEELLSTSEEDLPERIASYLIVSGNDISDSEATVIKSAPWLHIGQFSCLTASTVSNYAAIITIGLHNLLPAVPLPPKKHLHLECRERKLGSRDLRTQLPQLGAFVKSINQEPEGGILVCDPSRGKDLAAGVALALLCLYADGKGQLSRESRSNLDKPFIKQRLSWIMTSYPAASPSRATLQSINDYLLTEHAKDLSRSVNALSIEDRADNGCPAKTIFRALEGQWTLDREIENFRDDGLAGKVTGTATFFARTPTSHNAQLEYLYREEGTFNADPGFQMTVNRRWIWRLSKPTAAEENPSISIHFVKSDGETEDYLYNRLPTLREEPSTDSSATKILLVHADHPCGRDFYVSHYTFRRRDGRLERWDVRYEVKGPAKDYVSTTRYDKES